MVQSAIALRQALTEDKSAIYRWLYHSDHILDHLLEKGQKVPSLEEFYNEDFPDYFFTALFPEKGNCFVITKDDNAIGAISYSAFHLWPKIAELDIWLSSSQETGRGYGVSALIILIEKLKQQGFSRLFIRPAKHNIYAQKAYQKAGFRVNVTPELSRYYLPETIDRYGVGDFGANHDVFMEMIL